MLIDCHVNPEGLTPNEFSARVAAAGLDAVRRLAAADTGSVLLLFLSDGKPGDLQGAPPSGDHISADALPLSYRAFGQTHASAAVHLQGLRSAKTRGLSLHFVGIHAEGFPWLRALARC